MRKTYPKRFFQLKQEELGINKRNLTKKSYRGELPAPNSQICQSCFLELQFKLKFNSNEILRLCCLFLFQLSRVIKKIRAKHRLILSGTPIQNNVLELWSLFDFLMPGFLGTEREFTAKFGRPILQSRDAKSSSKEQEAGESMFAS